MLSSYATTTLRYGPENNLPVGRVLTWQIQVSQLIFSTPSAIIMGHVMTAGELVPLTKANIATNAS